MKIASPLALLFTLLISFSATAQPGGYKAPPKANYYFPVKEMMSETNYIFVNKNDTSEKSVFKVNISVFGMDAVMQTSVYDPKGRQVDYMVENIKDGVARISSYILTDYDSDGKKYVSSSKVLDSMVYNAYQAVGETINWKVSYQDYRTSGDCELSKSRKLISETPERRTYDDVLIFKILGSGKEYKREIRSVYQYGKGLVSYTMKLSDGTVKEFVLLEN